MSEFLATINSNNIKVVFTPSKRTAVKKIFIAIEGELTINQVADIKVAIAEVFSQFNILSIQLSNIKKIDMAAVQLLYVLSTAYVNNEKEVTIDSDFSQEDRALITSAGFSALLNKPKLANTNG